MRSKQTLRQACHEALLEAGFVRINPVYVTPEHAALIKDVAEISYPEVKRVCEVTKAWYVNQRKQPQTPE